MEATYAGDEAEARNAREAALRQRPSGAPRPKSVAWPIDCQSVRLAALQYYRAALEFYQKGYHLQGDYCISRGDAYALHASLCTRAGTQGVAPLLDAAPKERNPEAGVPSRSRLEAKLKEARGLRDPKAPPPPSVAAEAANEASCDGWYYIAFGEMLVASQYYSEGDSASGDYHISESQTALMMWESCEALAHTLSA